MAPGQPSRRNAPSLRHSLRWRLPLFFCALVVLMLASFLWATHRTVESSLVHAGRERAQAGADEVAEILGRAVRARLDENEELRTNPVIQALLRNPTDETRDAARKAFTPKGAFRRTEFWNAADSLVLELATPRADSATGPMFLPAGAPPVREGVSEVQATSDLNFFDVVVGIRDGPAPDAPHLGYLRRFGQITSTPGGRIRRLLGDEAVVKIGSITAAVWTDFYTIVEAPPLSDALGGVGDGRAAGTRWIGASAAVQGSPWVVWVGFPRALMLAPARPFMQRMMALALLLVAVGGALVAILGVRLTQPLHALARAAEEIAAGDYTRRVGTGRQDELGRLSDAFNTMTDRIEEVHGALRESHEQTHFALAAAHIGVWESQLATGQMTCSDSMRLVHGLPAGALPQTRAAFLALVHPDDRESVRHVLEGRRLDDEVFDIEYRALRPDGSVQWIEGKGQTRSDDAGRPVSVIGVSIDVTDRRRLESQLRQAQKMEAVGQLAGGVAHDFNNLLTSIVGHGTLVLGELKEESRMREDVIEILKAGESAAGLTRQLLAFSRRQVVQPEVIAVNAVVADTEKLLRRLIGEDIAFVTALAPDLDAVKVDPGHLEQVLVNLAVNARDAMPDGGTLTIATANVDLSGTYAREHAEVTPGRYVMLSVSDTGTGMDAETQARLFEPFFTTKSLGKGTGLGLATVFGIVKQSGGHIYVYSEPGIGSTFKIYLPATHESATAAPKRVAAPKAAGGTETILVVEDNAPVRAIAKTILERIGYRVLTASSGEEALRILEATEARLDLVVSDVIMPGMTGPELCRQLATRYPGLRVLFTSGYSGDALGRHGVSEPGTMFIEKPYTPSALANKVREALGHGSEPTTVKS